MAVFSENHMKHKNKKEWINAELLNVKAGCMCSKHWALKS
jgi:hypothetical protein